MLIVLKSGSLNLLEPSGPVQACNEIALPFIMEEFVVVIIHLGEELYPHVISQ